MKSIAYMNTLARRAGKSYGQYMLELRSAGYSGVAGLRFCDVCGEPFAAGSNRARVCGAECRAALRRAREAGKRRLANGGKRR